MILDSRTDNETKKIVNGGWLHRACARFSPAINLTARQTEIAEIHVMNLSRLLLRQRSEHVVTSCLRLLPLGDTMEIHFHLERVEPRYSKHRGFCTLSHSLASSLRFYGDPKRGSIPCRSNERRRLIVGARIVLSANTGSSIGEERRRELLLFPTRQSFR